MTDQRIPVYDLDNGVPSWPVEHDVVPVGKGMHEYRGFFLSKTNLDRDYTVIEPAPSKGVFGYFANIFDATEAVDAFLDRGVEPVGEVRDAGMGWIREREAE